MTEISADVSIIVRSKNEAQWLRLLLPLLKNQTLQNFEIILVDNNSTDGSVELAMEYSCKVVHIEQYTPGRALNIGISASTGSYLVFLSAHCLPVNDAWIIELFEEFSDRKCVGLYGRQVPSDISSNQTIRDLTITFGPEHKVQKVDSFFHNANAIISRKAWLEVQFDESLSNIEDRMWAKSQQYLGNCVVYSPKAAVIHYHGIHQDNNEARIIGTRDVLTKYGLTQIYPIKEMFSNVAIIFANEASEDLFSKTMDMLIKLKENNLFDSIILVGQNNIVAERYQYFIDQHISKRSSKSYFELLKDVDAEIVTETKKVFDNAFIFDTSYANRKMETVQKIYDKFLIEDVDFITAVYREMRNFLVVDSDKSGSISQKFLMKSRLVTFNHVLFKCSGYCTIIKRKSIQHLYDNSIMSSGVFEIKDFIEALQNVELMEHKR